MNKEQYLKQLSAELGKLKSSEREEIIADITEFFDCAARDGESVEAIVAHLGDPKKLGKEYWAQSCIAKANLKASPKSMARAFASSAALGTINFLYVLCVVVVGYIIISAFYVTAVCIGLSGITAVAAGIPYAGIVGPAGVFIAVMVGIAVICLGILAFIGNMQLAKLFKKANMVFLNRISAKLGRESNE